jgi:hypothetical protein
VYASWVEDKDSFMPPNPCPYRRIKTARGEEAINNAVQEGYFPLVKRVYPSEKTRRRMSVYQNIETGEIKTDPHMASFGAFLAIDRLDKTIWKEIIEIFEYEPDLSKDPIAAYLIPSGLKVGEQVFLLDVIENYIGDRSFGQNSRLKSVYAIWRGDNFEILWDEKKDPPHYVG